jgi:hypothetical protein
VTVTVSVWQKDGLCRGPAIGTAFFYQSFGIVVVRLTATAGGPLSGSTNVYTVSRPPDGSLAWNLQVGAPGYNFCTFFVRDGTTHEVWLPRANS